MEPRISLVTLGVSDLRKAIHFYRDGLGFPTTAKDDDPVAFFVTSGTRLSLFPINELAADIGDVLPVKGFGGIALAHNVRRKEEVAEVLGVAEKAGGRIVKKAQDTFWGGHAGYFSDLDGYYWEVAWAPMFSFDDRGALLFDKPE